MTKTKKIIKDNSSKAILAVIVNVVAFSLISTASAATNYNRTEQERLNIEPRKEMVRNATSSRPEIEKENGRRMGIGELKKGIFGTVTAINGNIITVKIQIASSSSVYTVDATNASIYKNNATSTISSILVGDKIMINGDISTSTSNTLKATVIRDGEIKGDLKNPFETQNKNVGFFGKIKNFFSKIFHK